MNSKLTDYAEHDIKSADRAKYQVQQDQQINHYSVVDSLDTKNCYYKPAQLQHSLLATKYKGCRLIPKRISNPTVHLPKKRFEPPHEISNNVLCATSKASDQPVHTRSLIRAFASHLNIL